MKICKTCGMLSIDFYKGHSSCKKCVSKRASLWNSNHKQQWANGIKNWKKKNRLKLNEKEKERCKNDLIFKISKNLRNRLRQALKNNQKSGSAVSDLGCSIPELKIYLESKFKPGMSWDNWGLLGWHLDHIIPLVKASTPQELIKLCHYTNLQPLWAKDNLIKGDK